jgi:hypothetical protein
MGRVVELKKDGNDEMGGDKRPAVVGPSTEKKL